MISELDLPSGDFTPRQLFELADRLRDQSYRFPEDLALAAHIVEHAGHQLLLQPLDDERIKSLVLAATKGGALLRAGNASQRIVKAVERYYGIASTESMCPCCGKPITDPPCSMNSDGAFHVDHPHNPAFVAPRLFR